MLVWLTLTLTRRRRCVSGWSGSVFVVLAVLAAGRQRDMLLWISCLWEVLSRLSLLLQNLLLILWRPSSISWGTSCRTLSTVPPTVACIISVRITIASSIAVVDIASRRVVSCIVTVERRGVTITRKLIIRSYSRCELGVSKEGKSQCLPKSAHVITVLRVSVVTRMPSSSH